MWYAMHLASASEDVGGDRLRLLRELNRLKLLGIKVLRVLACGEGDGDAPGVLRPALQPTPLKYDERLLKGLDYLLVQAAERDMTLLLILNNFWPWSGGFGQYLAWAGAVGQPERPVMALGGVSIVCPYESPIVSSNTVGADTAGSACHPWLSLRCPRERCGCSGRSHLARQVCRVCSQFLQELQRDPTRSAACGRPGYPPQFNHGRAVPRGPHYTWMGVSGRRRGHARRVRLPSLGTSYRDVAQAGVKRLNRVIRALGRGVQRLCVWRCGVGLQAVCIFSEQVVCSTHRWCMASRWRDCNTHPTAP